MSTTTYVFVEKPQRGASNEYPQHMFSSRSKKNIDTFRLKKCLIKSYAVCAYLFTLPLGVILVCVL